METESNSSVDVKLDNVTARTVSHMLSIGSTKCARAASKSNVSVCLLYLYKDMREDVSCVLGSI